MRKQTKSRWATIVTVGSGLYRAFARADTVVGHFTFWDNFKEKVLPIWRDHVLAMLTNERLAWILLIGGIASLAWINFGEWIANGQTQTENTLQPGAAGAGGAASRAKAGVTSVCIAPLGTVGLSLRRVHHEKAAVCRVARGRIAGIR